MPLAGCADNHPEASAPGAFTDALGRTVRLPETPERVVTLAPSLTEVLYTAGAGNRLVGVGISDDYPPQVVDLPRFSTLPVDFEAIASLQPDLVLATDQINSPRDAATLEALAIPTFFLPAQSVTDVISSVRTVGELLGTSFAANRAADSLEQRIASLEAVTSQVEDPPSVLFLISGDPLFSFGRESYVHDLIEMAGGKSATANLTSVAPVLNEEYVLTVEPDVIIGTFGEAYDAGDLLAEHPTWAAVPAVRDRRVYTIDDSLIQRPGPRLIEGAYQMARILHPNLLAPLNGPTRPDQ